MFRSLIKSCKQVADGLTSGVLLAPKPIVLYSFNSQKVVDKWHVFTDAFFGGTSQATFQYSAGEQSAEFSGRCSLDQEEDADIKRAGYCVASSKVEHIGDYFDLSGFSHLVYNVKGDGRVYIANVRVDSMAGTGGDVWQAPFKPSAGMWSKVSIPIDSLALTYQGQLVERQLEFQADKVISVGVAVSANMQAPEAPGSSGSSRSSAAGDQHQSGATGDGTHSSQESSSGSVSSTVLEASSEGSTVQQPPPAAVPSHELFRLFIRDIRAEGEM